MFNTNSLIDTNAIEVLVKDKVAEIVVSEVNRLIESPNSLLTAIRRDASAELAKKLVHSHSDLDVNPMITAYVAKNISKYLNNADIERVVKEQIDAPISRLLETASISKLIEQQVVSMFVKRLTVQLNNIDINKMIADKVNVLFNEHVKNIEYTGLVDNASKTELTILDNTVVVENEFISNEIKVIKSLEAGGNLIVKKDLILHGDINTDAKGWVKLSNNIERNVLKKFQEKLKEELQHSILEKAKTENIDFASVTIGGKKLVENGVLHKTIIISNLKKVGQLDNLNVKREAEIYSTLFVVNKRIGINTTEPSMALAVWDEEVEVIAGKSKSQTAFIGTGRKQGLEIGINRKAEIIIKDDGLVVINKLQIGKNRLKYSTDLPGYQGSKGDIVFNVNISPSKPVFAWVCIGGHRWMPLKAVI
jgi:hypothetical protein